MPHGILIIGAGIGGLATAIGLAKAGYKVTIAEQAQALSEVGAGLQLSPNAVHALRALGLEHIVAPRASRIDYVQMFNGHGLLQYLDIRTLAAHYNAPFWALHRADLQIALLEKALKYDLIELKLGHKLTKIAHNEFGVEAQFENGEAIHAIAAIGADGVNSAMRRTVFGVEAQPTGLVAWRGLAPLLPAQHHTVDVHLTPESHVVSYPLIAHNMRNIVWVEHAPALPAHAPTHSATHAQLNAFLAHNTKWTYWPLTTVPPLKTWCEGPIVIMGDAAHAMVPFAAQGAGMALEDAAALVSLCKNANSVDAFIDAFKAFEQARKPRTEAVQDLSAHNGVVYHQTGVIAHIRNLIIKYSGSGIIRRRMDWIWGWQPDST